MRFAYADPPYPGQAKRHYGNDPRAAEVDHAALVAMLQEFDGWALSTSSSALREVLAVCPPGVRIGAWVKPWASWKPGINPAFAWEPVIFSPAKRKRNRREPTARDWVSVNAIMRGGGNVHGQKPDMFCYWLFDILRMSPEDHFADVYPGSGRVSRAWRQWQRQLWREGASA